jgi:hypothetical protein
LRTLFDSVRPEGSQLVQLDCRSTICRADIAHQDAQARQRLIAALGATGSFTNDGEQGLLSSFEDKGGLRSSYFMARDKHKLPAAGMR